MLLFILCFFLYAVKFISGIIEKRDFFINGILNLADVHASPTLLAANPSCNRHS
jgi:hypothetical protein